MKHTVSLKKPHEFRRLYAKGRSAAGAYIIFYQNGNRGNITKLGITATTKLGGAVTRNRIRRRIREAYRAVENDIPPGRNIIIVAKKDALTADFEKMKREIVRLARKTGI